MIDKKNIEFIYKVCPDIKFFMSHPIINDILSVGGIIAGGFARQCMLGNSVIKYTIDNGGDIDIFFKCAEDADRALKIVQASNLTLSAHYNRDNRDIGVLRISRSITGIATNVIMETHNDINKWKDINSRSRIKIQLINEFFGKPKDILNTFDFTNVKCAITKDNVYIDNNFYNIESQKKIDIVNISSPLLAARIVKYLRARGMLGITSRSQSMLKDWCVNFCSGIYDNPLFDLTSKQVNNSCMASIYSFLYMQGFLDKEILSKDAIILFLGMFKKNHWNSTVGGYSSIDLAVNALTHIKRPHNYEGR